MPASIPDFLSELLAEQNRLDTPVARFATAHASDAATLVAPLTSQLIPLTAPKPGEQYAFQVDLDSCTGCKSCVAACHSLNGLDDTETWRDVGLLVSPSRTHPFLQTVTTACHHCADPACLNGCPVLAYEKDSVTGIVRHLDDQCIGCSYCILKCPYDVPKFSQRLGIVRKCDMCHSRLAEGEAPACAQACPTHAITIVTVPVEASPTFLPAAPDPSYTQPTTRYVSARTFPPNLIAGDATTLRVQPAHWPLVVMLTLMPVAVGLAAAAAVLAATSPQRVTQPISLFSWLAGALGLGASVFHLGQPLRAWRIFLGWRTSWLSREAMAFGTWFGLATAAFLFPRLAVASASVGVLALYCSAMIYVNTHRVFWSASQTMPRFFGTALMVALTLISPPVAALGLLLKMAWESRTQHGQNSSARLQRGPLASLVVAREALALISVVLLLAAPGWAALAFLTAGELLERLLFFRAVDAPKMPGLPT